MQTILLSPKPTLLFLPSNTHSLVCILSYELLFLGLFYRATVLQFLDSSEESAGMYDNERPHQACHQRRVENIEVYLGMSSRAIWALDVFGDSEDVSDKHQNACGVDDTQMSNPMDSVVNRDRGRTGVHTSVEHKSHNEKVGENDELEDQADDRYRTPILLN